MTFDAKEFAKTAVAMSAIGGAAFGLVGVSYVYAGPVATIVYAFLFLFGLFGMPALITLGAPSFPDSMRKAIGGLHVILGQAALGVGYLVQYDDRYEVHPGTKDRIWIDGNWREIESGKTNLKILGWQPFGMVRFKQYDTLEDERVDPATQSRADGGTEERGGFEGVPPDPSVSGLDGEWLVDLKLVVTSGVRKMGDIDVLEKAEEIIMRKESRGGRMEGREALMGSIVGLVLGIATGYFLLGGV